jgi:hypothetical protein
MSRLASLLGFPVAVVVLSLAAGLALLGPGLAQAEKGKKYALLVGVKDYLHPDLASLSYTENDVVELADALKGFAEVVVLTTSAGAKDAEASPTAKNIRTQLGRLLKKATRHDTILIALAGHGLQLKLKDRGEEEGFFCPTDARPGEDVTFAEQSKTMISFSELFKELKESYVGVKLLLVDACRNNPTAGRSVNADTIPRPPNGLAALFSCRGGERAFETDKLGGGHGVFFHHVIEGLKGEARNRKGEVTWDSLAEYVKEKVSDDVPRLIKKGAKQTPEEIKKLVGKAPVLVGAERAAVAGGEGPKGEGLENRCYPLQVGRVWHRQSDGGKKFTAKVVKHEKINGVLCALVETSGTALATSTSEHVAVRDGAVLRYAANGKLFTPPVVILKLPPKKGETWKVESKSGEFVVKGTFTSGEEDVTVPAGTYEKAVTVTTKDLQIGSVSMTTTAYYARDVGLVKTVTQFGGTKFVTELVKFEAP